MNGQGRIDERRRRQAGRRGFTLIELLVVMLIILLVSAVVLPTVLPAISHRQVSEAARILQGALVGARDTAINNNAPAGIRLLPDPVFNGINPSTASTAGLDPTRILAANRYIPIQLAPDYSEGFADIYFLIDQGHPPFTRAFPYWLTVPYLAGQTYPTTTNSQLLYIEQAYYDSSSGVDLLNPPTSWYWNVRIGDRIQLINTGRIYTVVGPMDIFNSELFVNLDPTLPVPLTRTTANNNTYAPEFLFLVDGLDDNGDGFVDNGCDGIDNDGDGYADDLTEWVEPEQWQASALLGNLRKIPYTITRRPVVSPGSRETLLPSNVVVDLTTWYPPAFGTGYVKERSRLPVDPNTGNVDILLNPNGTVVPTTEYSSPSSFGMDSAFYHFWLAERGDLFDPVANPNVPYLLPMVPRSTYPSGTPYPNVNDPLGTRALTGERRLMTLHTRTGQLITNQVETFDATPLPYQTPAGLGPGPNYPFLAPQQGVRGDTR